MPSWKKVIVSGSNAVLNNITSSGDFKISGNISGSSTSTGSFAKLELTSNITGSDVFTVDGLNGRLFTVTDEMSGSIFSANLISGLPVIEAFSDNRVNLGPFSSPIQIDSSGNISGSSTSTGSFGHLLVGGSEIASSPDATDGSQDTISGSSTSTGSFGSLTTLTGIDIGSRTLQSATVEPVLRFTNPDSDTPNNSSLGLIQFWSLDNSSGGRTSGSMAEIDVVTQVNYSGTTDTDMIFKVGDGVVPASGVAPNTRELLRLHHDGIVKIENDTTEELRNLHITSIRKNQDVSGTSAAGRYHTLQAVQQITSSNNSLDFTSAAISASITRGNNVHDVRGDIIGVASSLNLAGTFSGTHSGGKGIGVDITTSTNGLNSNFESYGIRANIDNANNGTAYGLHITAPDNYFSGNISGSSTSTGSFGQAHIGGNTPSNQNLHIQGDSDITAGLRITQRSDGNGWVLRQDDNFFFQLNYWTGTNSSAYSTALVAHWNGEVTASVQLFSPRLRTANITIAPSGATDTIRRSSGDLFLQFGAGASSKVKIGNTGKTIIDDTIISGSATSTGSFGNIQVAQDFLPTTDNNSDLGAADKRWANIYSADLQLSNEGTEGNEVDGTTGNWTIQEGKDDLYLLNRKNGKKYKFKLEEID